jgi:hypothetical protein
MFSIQGLYVKCQLQQTVNLMLRAGPLADTALVVPLHQHSSNENLGIHKTSFPQLFRNGARGFLSNVEHACHREVLFQ